VRGSLSYLIKLVSKGFWNKLHLTLYEDLCSHRNVDDTAEHFQLLPLVHKEFQDADFICCKVEREMEVAVLA
jgi:hypothetical protein